MLINDSQHEGVSKQFLKLSSSQLTALYPQTQQMSHERFRNFGQCSGYFDVEQMTQFMQQYMDRSYLLTLHSVHADAALHSFRCKHSRSFPIQTLMLGIDH